MTQLSTEILRLSQEGKSYRQIQAELGCSKGTISYHLGVGQKEKNLARFKVYRNKIKDFLREYKQERGCADCKEMYPYWMLQFDHLGDKEFTISQWSRTSVTIEEVKKEVEKCEVVCANCHANRTHVRKTTDGGGLLDVSENYIMPH